MIAPAGTTLWFAEHEWRLAWRDWLAMMSGGRRKRLRRAVIAIGIFVLFMHFVAYWMVGRYADAVPDKSTLVAITGSVLLSWLLMISQAMESTTRAFYARSDLDLILASPVAAEKIFAVRIATVALSMAMMALPLAAPFIDILIARGGWRWFGAYGLVAAMGAAATALAVGFSVALFRTIGATTHAICRAGGRSRDRRRFCHRPANRCDPVLRHHLAGFAAAVASSARAYARSAERRFGGRRAPPWAMASLSSVCLP